MWVRHCGCQAAAPTAPTHRTARRYEKPTQLAPFPLEFEATPTKPILFDLVDRGLEFPLAGLEGKGAKKGW